MSDEKENKKDIEIISGDGSNLLISPVYEHINAAKPKISKDKNPKNIVIPEEKKKKNKSKK